MIYKDIMKNIFQRHLGKTEQHFIPSLTEIWTEDPETILGLIQLKLMS
jgi:hypothetical protein